MSFPIAGMGFIGRALMSAISRFVSPKYIVVDIAMRQELYVKNNLRVQSLKYYFSRRDQVIARSHDGWRIAVGRNYIFLTEQYVDRKKELILMCKDA